MLIVILERDLAIYMNSFILLLRNYPAGTQLTVWKLSAQKLETMRISVSGTGHP
jgi:hypothetical protein